MKTAMTVEYDGAGYSGFQRQKQQNSVQAELERCLTTVLRHNVRVWCAGRTDTGVNALGQVVHFASDTQQNLHRLIYALNSLLPKDIAVRHAAPVPDDFHARFSCLAREYVYVIYNAPYRPTTLTPKAFWVREPLNWDLMRVACQYLVGVNDFAAFTKVAVIKRGEPTIRRIDGIDVVVKGQMTYIYIRGSGFLHNMIRILVGTLLEVARGELAPEKLRDIVASADRLEAGVTLKADALYFLYAEYKDYDQSAVQHELRKMLQGKN